MPAGSDSPARELAPVWTRLNYTKEVEFTYEQENVQLTVSNIKIRPMCFARRFQDQSFCDSDILMRLPADSSNSRTRLTGESADRRRATLCVQQGTHWRG